MNLKLLVTAAAVAALAAGAAAAQATPAAGSTDTQAAAPAAAGSDTAAKPKAHHKRMASNERRSRHNAYAAPEQPIPYAMLDQYMKASPKERTAMLQQANTGNTADVSATAPAAPPASSTPQ